MKVNNVVVYESPELSVTAEVDFSVAYHTTYMHDVLRATLASLHTTEVPQGDYKLIVTAVLVKQ